MCDDGIGDFVGLDWADWMIIGLLSEEIAEEKREQERLEREMSEDDFIPPTRTFELMALISPS